MGDKSDESDCSLACENLPKVLGYSPSKQFFPLFSPLAIRTRPCSALVFWCGAEKRGD